MLRDTGGEIALLRAISTYRPLGLHRHFNMISIIHNLQNAPAEDDAPKGALSAADVWAKLGEFYDLEGLNELDDGSDDEDAPEWLRNYEEHATMLAKNEAARTRVLENDDEEEFGLHPSDAFEAIVAPRRLEKGESAKKVVPPSDDDDLSEMDSEGDHTNEGARTRTRADARRTRKQADEESQETPASPDGGHRSKRRRTQNEDTPEAPARPITRRQRQLEDEAQDEAAPDEAHESDTPVAGSTRSGRATPMRRAASSAAPTPEPHRVAQTRAANKNAASPARSSPTPAARARTRRDSGR